jgi:hypothetical protein
VEGFVKTAGIKTGLCDWVLLPSAHAFAENPKSGTVLTRSEDFLKKELN